MRARCRPARRAPVTSRRWPITRRPRMNPSGRSGAWVSAARAAGATHAFGEAARAYERAIDLWDAVPADDRPTDTDAAALYHEGALAAMVSGSNDRAVDLARAAVERLDPADQLERWADANERLARAMWISGGTDEGLERLEATAEALERTGHSPVRARVLAAHRGFPHAARRPPAGDRGGKGRDRGGPRDRRTPVGSARAQHPRHEHVPARRLRRGPAHPAGRLRPDARAERRGRPWPLLRQPEFHAAHLRIGRGESPRIDGWRRLGARRGREQRVRALPRRQRRRCRGQGRPLGCGRGARRRAHGE